jgi:hypothetical protein
LAEGQHRDRRLVGERRPGTRPRGCRARSRHHAVCPNGPRDVLERLLAHILELEGELVAHLVAHHAADADAAWLRQGFKPSGDVDAIAENVVPIDDDVAEIDADAKFDTRFGRHTGISPGHLSLHVNAHRTASTTLANSTNNPSPVVLTMRPRCSTIRGSTKSRLIAFNPASVPSSSAPISRE